MSLNVAKVARSLASLAVLKYFPADDYARAEIVALVCRMATTHEQVEWLTRRTVDLWNEWQGPKELRAVFCARYKPADGIESFSTMPQFIDGIPADPELQLTAPPPRAVPGVVETGPFSIYDFISEATLNNKRIRRDPLAGVKPATDAEIDAIKAEQRRRQADRAQGQELTR